jgi:PAS domain S-box-containing protein
VIILFIATWVALFLSKQVTVPIQALAEATHQVALGNLDHRIQVQAVDELGVLVRSFNEMMARLQESGAELDRRRRETEAILESIPTPVISLTRDRRILRVNPAVERIFGPERARVSTLRDLLAPDDLREMEHLMRRAQRRGLATSQFELNSAVGRLSVAVTVSALPSKQEAGLRGQDIAFIVVMEDVSDLLHAQQAQAWRDVAQRVAHEIKNPLTPIALSAERLRRRMAGMENGQTPEELAETQRVIADCAGLIEQEVGTLKTLVDEFSQLARFPNAQLQVAQLNPIVENALSVFDGRLDGVHVSLDLAPDLPPVHVDPEQFKRVIVNLVDNAAEALQDSLVKEVRISTARLGGGDPRGEFIEVVVADTGPGVSPEVKEKLFLPYFSTKKRGTGLGLAIVSRILAEHRGSIRVEENHPVGARFILELPV